MDISKQQFNIEGVSKGMALADPTKDLKIVAEGATEGLFVAPTDATRGLVDPDAPDATELRALYSDPDAFFASGHFRAAHHLNAIQSVLIDGQQTEPKVVRVKNDPNVYIKVGRSRLVWNALAYECLAGTRVIKAISALIAERRETFGPNWRPDFRVMSGGRLADNADAYVNDVVIENFIRKETGDRGRYNVAMDRITKIEYAHRNDEKAPVLPYAEIGRVVNRSEGHVKSWHKLSKLPQSVIDAVFSDDPDNCVSLNFVMQFCKNGVTPEEIARLVAEHIAAGATSVSDARATRRAMTGGYDGDEANGSDEEPDGDEEPSEKKERTVAKFADKPLSGKVIAEYSDALNDKGNHDETLALAAMKLATKGWRSLSAKEKKAINGIGTLSATIEAAKKAYTERLAKKAEKAAKAAAGTNGEAPAAEPAAAG